MSYAKILTALSAVLSAQAVQAAPALMLAKEYGGQNITGWAMSEKLDGVRAYWNGKQLLSRQGHAFTPPAGYTAAFPPYPVDGELYSGRGKFQEISAAVRSASGNWRDIRLHVFDVPEAHGNLYRRLAVLQEWLALHPGAPIRIVAQTPVDSAGHAAAFLKTVEAQGGEGVMLRDPEAPYAAGRSGRLLKYKSAHDAECTVVRHYEGKGKYSGLTGALGCKNHLGEFRIGSGLKDQDRANPPPVGSTVTYRYRGYTQKGLPRFATFVRIRNDK